MRPHSTPVGGLLQPDRIPCVWDRWLQIPGTRADPAYRTIDLVCVAWPCSDPWKLGMARASIMNPLTYRDDTWNESI